jgi:hypothetical protein
MPVPDAPSRRATQVVQGPVASYAGTGGRYGEQVERPKDLPAAIDRSSTVMRREKRHALLNVIGRV